MPAQKSLSGWLTAKKSGRDDPQIAKDQQRALSARKQQARSRPKAGKAASKATSKVTAKAGKPPNRRKTADSEESADDDDGDDDDDSINDFVVDDDDDDDEEALVLDSDDDEAEEEEESDEDELEVELELVDAPLTKPKPKLKAKAKTSKRVAVEEDDSDDSSDEGGSFFPTHHKARTSKPSQALRKATDAVKTRRLPALMAHPKRNPMVDLTTPAVKPSRRTSTIKPKATKPKTTKPKTTKPKQKQKSKPTSKPIQLLDDEDKEDDDDSEMLSSPSPSPCKPSKRGRAVVQNQSKYFGSRNAGGAKVTPQDSSEDEGRAPSNQGHKKRSPSSSILKEDESDDDASPWKRSRMSASSTAATDSLAAVGAAAQRPTPTTTTRSRPLVLDDSSEEEDRLSSSRPVAARASSSHALDDTPEKSRYQPKNTTTTTTSTTTTTKPWTKKTSTSNTTSRNNNNNNNNRFAQFQHSTANDDDTNNANDSDDSADRLLLKQALKASRKDQPRLRKAPAQTGDEEENDDDDEEPVADESLLAETSDEEEPEDQGDEYDEEHEAATSVLHTAEQLSAQVLRCMIGWSQQDGSSQDGASAQQGLIVNGALSLGDLNPTTSPTGGGHSTSTTKTATTTTTSTTNDQQDHEWISQQVMKQACSGVTLSNYQLVGVNWLALLHGMKCEIEGKATPVNGVLADEMGLGKTVQTIAFLAWLKHRRATVQKNNKESVGPHLIVVPVSVLPNWMREFETFCPEMTVFKYHGSLAEREEIQDNLRQYLPSRRSRNGPGDDDAHQNPSPSLDVILAPVTYFQKEKSDDRRFLNKFQFEYLVVDEAHMLKNSQSTRYRMLDRVSTRHRLLLTGTPVQNSPQELLNMLCFIMPLFSKGTDSMDGESSDNKGDRMLQHFVDAEKEQSGDEQVAYQKLKHLFAPFVLRRKKQDVIGQLLPAKERFVEYVQLDAAGRSMYESILAAHLDKNGTKVTAAIGDHIFTNLRKAAHHPLLLRGRHNTSSEVAHLTTYFHKYGAFKGEGSTKARVGEEISKFNDFNIHLTALELIEENPHRRADLERYILNEEALFSSAKFARLRSLLPGVISNGHRVLIFSGWTSCLDLLGCLMEHLKLQYLRMDGSCASDIRQERIDRFNQNSSIQVFLLSTRACGLGINLTAADTCIIHDLDFNPFNDLQAEDRCHRIGQKKKVTVYKMVTQDTVDSDIFNMQERKSKMNAAIMESGEAKKERKAMLQTAVNRFLGSPKAKSKRKTREFDKENDEEEMVCIL